MSFKIAWFFRKLHIKLFYTFKTFNLSSFSVLKCYFSHPCFQLQQNVPRINEMTRMISARIGISGVRLAHHISYTSMVTCLWNCTFRNRHWKGTFEESRKKNCSITLFFSEESPQRVLIKNLTPINFYYRTLSQQHVLIFCFQNLNLNTTRSLFSAPKTRIGWLKL